MPTKGTGWSRIAAYLILILLPVFLVTFHRLETPDEFAYNLGRCFGLMAFVIIVLQVALAARLKWIESPFGLNLTFPFHRRMAVFAACLLLTHPFLMVLGGAGWHLLLGFDQPWYIYFGKAALILLLANVGLSLWRMSLGVSFERWRCLHDVLGPLILVLAFFHSWNASVDFSLGTMRFLWVALLLLAVGLFVHHRFYTPSLLRRQPYKVVEVRQETHDAWTLAFAPPPAQTRFDFLPGQFQFVTLLRGRGLPEEEHHFTISSSPATPGVHTSTIKASGDFTATIGETRPGDLAVIQAPFGRFSYLFHPQAQDLVFIAGGIGITPFMSNLRYMKDVGEKRRVLLLYSNKTERDIVFRQELAEMEDSQTPALQVIHILTRPQENWPGERGRLDRLSLKRLCGEGLDQGFFFLCCPPPMTLNLVQALLGLGVPDSRISYEYFSL